MCHSGGSNDNNTEKIVIISGDCYFAAKRLYTRGLDPKVWKTAALHRTNPYAGETTRKRKA